VARFAQNRNLVIRAVGVDPDLEVEIHDSHTASGDIYLLCSDGLSDMLAAEEISSILASSPPTLESACEALVLQANDNGGHDNISVILISTYKYNMQAIGLFRRLLHWVRDMGQSLK
jgi:PPM family protein phosphatase